MNPDQDAYGKELWAYYTGQEVREIVERDDGFLAASPHLPAAYFNQYKDWPGAYKQALKRAHGKVLDIGCGAGRISLYLQEKGVHAIGIDNSPLAIKVCKKRGLKRAKVLSIDEVHTFKPRTFGTVLMFGNNFGLFGSLAKARRLLKNLHRITTDHALIIAETKEPQKNMAPIHREYRKRNKDRGRMPGQIRIRIRFEKTKGPWFDYLFVSKKEMKMVLKGTGWRVKTFLDADPPSYLAILEKGNPAPARSRPSGR